MEGAVVPAVIVVLFDLVVYHICNINCICRMQSFIDTLFDLKSGISISSQNGR
jgi:hypothetical protein